MSDIIKEFEKLLNQITDQGLGGNVDLLLSEMDEESAEHLKLCAIPHQFDLELLSVLLPKKSEEQVKNVFQELEELSIVVSSESEALFHEEVREHLFRKWFTPDLLPRFQKVSGDLETYFKEKAKDVTGFDKESYENSAMFHLLGKNQAEGFTEFQRLINKMWKQYRLNQCEILIHMVKEYEPILEEEYRLWLIYYDARLTAESRDLDKAQNLLGEILKHEDPPKELLMKSQHRAGILYSEQRNWDRATKILLEALQIAGYYEEYHDYRDEIMHDIGTVFLKKRDYRNAQKYLKEGLKIATEQNDLASMASAYNSLGNLYRKLTDPQRAIEMYEKSLETLNQHKDKFRPAQVYNNLGMVYSGLREWKKSEDFLKKSLEIKKRAGDIKGQAMTLTNLVRVYRSLKLTEQAILTSNQAIELFTAIKDQYNIAQCKRNLGKLHRNLRNYELAGRYFNEAITIFRNIHELQNAENTQVELAALNRKNRRTPWWVWGAVIIFFLFMMLLFALENY